MIHRRPVLLLSLAAAAACQEDRTAPERPVASVTVTLASSQLVVQQTTTASATLRDAGGREITGRQVTWSSTANSVATVSTTGLVTAAAPGSAGITATYEGKSGTAVLTVALPPVETIEVRLGTSQLFVGQTTTASAILRDAGGVEITGRQVTWSSSAPSVATVAANGLVTAAAPGSATITATYEGKSGTAVLAVTLPPVETIEVQAAADQLFVGETTTVSAILRDIDGNVLTGREVDWSSSAPAVATVSTSGSVSAVAPGSATITATSEGKQGGALIATHSRQTIILADSLLEPGNPLLMRGFGLASASVLIAGLPAPVVAASDTALTVLVPTEPWSPCLGPQHTFPVSVTRPGLATVQLVRRAAERPIALNLAPGEHEHVPETMFRTCRIVLSSAGLYLAMPYIPERPDANPASREDSVSVTIELGNAATTAPAPATPLPVSAPSRSPAAGLARGINDVVLTTPGSRAANCSLPPPGGTVKVFTVRDAQGQITNFGGLVGSEDWTVVSVGQTIAVIFDTATIRLAQGNPQLASAVTELIAFSDSAAVPFINAVTRGLSDVDENGKLIVYISIRGAPGLPNLAFGGSNMRNDCLGGGPAAAGEAIFLNWTYPSGGAPAYVQWVFLHELGHVADFRWDANYSGRWAVEGFANFIATLFPLRASKDPLNLNLGTRPDYPDGGAANCLWPLAESMRGAPWGDAWSYPIGCNMVSYLLSQYRRRFGGTLKDAITAWSGTSVIIMPHADAGFLRQEGDSTFAHWLLSWYSDDLVGGTGPDLQQSMWNLRQLWDQQLSYAGPYPMPDARLSSGTPAVSFTLGAPDARYVEFSGSPDARLTVRPATASPTPLRLVVLRSQ